MYICTFHSPYVHMYICTFVHLYICTFHSPYVHMYICTFVHLNISFTIVIRRSFASSMNPATETGRIRQRIRFETLTSVVQNFLLISMYTARIRIRAEDPYESLYAALVQRFYRNKKMSDNEMSKLNCRHQNVGTYHSLPFPNLTLIILGYVSPNALPGVPGVSG
jgi:hypothetical protein